MAIDFQLEVATPERLVIREQVQEAQIPAANGYIGVLPDHAPLVSELGAGALSYRGSSGATTMAISGGWVEVVNNEVRVLTDRAEKANEIDVARAQAALKRALDRLASGKTDEVDVPRALDAMKRAEARLAVAGAKSA